MKTSNEVINGLDFTQIKKKLQRTLGWTKAQVDKAELDYKRFLMEAKRHPNSGLVPTVTVDEFWHAHILDTERYHKDCNVIFGEYLHHRPSYTEVATCEKVATCEHPATCEKRMATCESPSKKATCESPSHATCESPGHATCDNPRKVEEDAIVA